MSEKSVLQQLADFHLSKCDGDWEHLNWVKLETTDNPGWLLAVDLPYDYKGERMKRVIFWTDGGCSVQTERGRLMGYAEPPSMLDKMMQEAMKVLNP